MSSYPLMIRSKINFLTIIMLIMKIKKTLIVLWGILITSFYCFSQDFSEWIGIGRTGVYNEKGLLKRWPILGPQLLWSAKGLPKGFSSMSIANNLVYFTGLKDTIDFLVAVDFKGQKKWETPIGESWVQSFPDSRCTPTIEGDRVYVTSGTGNVACYNSITGESIWNIDTIKKFDGKLGDWGCAESLLLVDDKVIFTACGEETTLVAQDKKTGATIWTSKSLKDTAAYVSPLLVNEGGKKLIITVTANYLVVANAENGEILCSSKYASLSNEKSLKLWTGGPNCKTNTPVYYDRKIFVTGGYDHVGALYRLSDDLKTLTVDWINETLDVHHGGVVLVNGYIYGSNWITNSVGNWCCLDWKTGKTMYEKKWKTKGSIIANDGMLYCYEEKTGYLALVKAIPESFSLVSSFRIPFGSGPFWAHPVIKNGILYVRHGDAIMAYNIKE